MLDPRTQRIIGWVALLGVLAACSACGLLWQNQVTPAIALIVLADLILLPTFVILLRTRRRTKRIVRRQEEQRQAELDALAGVDHESTGPRGDAPRNEA